MKWFICDVASLVFWLGAVPGFEDLVLEDHLDVLNSAVTDFMTPQGIESNEHRELMIVQKL